MSAPAAGSFPYGDAPERRRATGPMVLDRPRPAFKSLEELAYDTGPLPVRVPGEALARELAGPVRPANPESSMAVLWDTAAALRPAARGSEGIYAGVLAEHGRHAAPAPVAGPEPEPAAEPERAPEPPADAEPLAAVAVPEGLQKRLRDLVDYAALGISALMAGHGTTPELIALGGRLARLGHALTLADDDEDALRALVTEGGQ